MKKIPFYSLLVTTAVSGFSAQAADWQFEGLVAPAISVDDLPYKDTDTQVDPSLLVMGRVGDLFIEGNRAGYRLTRTEFGALSVVGQLRTHQYIPDDSPLGERDKAVELGLQLAKPIGMGWSLQATALTDISDTHQGQEFELGAYRRDSFGDFRLLSLFAVQVQSDKLTGYYADGEGYEAEGDVNYEIELIGVYPLTENVEAALVYRHYFNGSELKNSPLTDASSTQKLTLGIGWRF